MSSLGFDMVSDGGLIIVTTSDDNKNIFETMKRPPRDESKGRREEKGDVREKFT